MIIHAILEFLSEIKLVQAKFESSKGVLSFFLKFIYFEREHTCTREDERERERKYKQALCFSVEPNMGLDPMNHELEGELTEPPRRPSFVI